jgi:hypothetical protein
MENEKSPFQSTQTLGGRTAKIRWYSELTASHGKVLLGSFLGWVFDGYEN